MGMTLTVVCVVLNAWFGGVIDRRSNIMARRFPVRILGLKEATKVVANEQARGTWSRRTE